MCNKGALQWLAESWRWIQNPTSDEGGKMGKNIDGWQGICVSLCSVFLGVIQATIDVPGMLLSHRFHSFERRQEFLRIFNRRLFLCERSFSWCSQRTHNRPLSLIYLQGRGAICFRFDPIFFLEFLFFISQ